MQWQSELCFCPILLFKTLLPDGHSMFSLSHCLKKTVPKLCSVPLNLSMPTCKTTQKHSSPAEIWPEIPGPLHSRHKEEVSPLKGSRLILLNAQAAVALNSPCQHWRPVKTLSIEMTNRLGWAYVPPKSCTAGHLPRAGWEIVLKGE